jgi:inosine-uridine nucleoside N-ribohydrolase
VGLFNVNDEIVQTALARTQDLKAIEGLAEQIKTVEKITIVATGLLTNIASFVSVYPELIAGIDQICFMGGGVGIGNRSAVSGMHFPYPGSQGSTRPATELNILCNREVEPGPRALQHNVNDWGVATW